MLLKMDHERIKTMLVEAIRGKQTSEIVHELEEIARETTKDCSGESVENIFENTLRN